MKKGYLRHIFAKAHRELDRLLAHNFSLVYRANQRFARERLPKVLQTLDDETLASARQIERMYRKICKHYVMAGEVQSYIENDERLVDLQRQGIGLKGTPIEKYIREKIAADHTKDIIEMQEAIFYKFVERIVRVEERLRKAKPEWFNHKHEKTLRNANKLYRDSKNSRHKVHLKAWMFHPFSEASGDRMINLAQSLDTVLMRFAMDDLRASLEHQKTYG